MPPEEIVTVPSPLNVPKESGEVVDTAFAIVEHFKKGGDLAGATLLLPNVLQAVEGHEKIGAEVKSKYKSDLAAHLLKKGMDTLGV